MAETIPIQSIKRALDVLDYLTTREIAGEGATLQALAGYLDVASPTAHNILRTMVTCGYVARDRDHLYRLGPRCRDIARGSLLGGGLLEAATGIVHSLAERTGESVVLATLAHGRRYPLIRADGHAVIRVSPSFEGTDLFFETVTGRVLAAYALPAEREAILSVQGWPDARWEGIAGEAALQNALAPIRARGIAEDLSSKTGVFSLAAPVLDSRERLVAALGIYLPASRATEEHLAHIRTELAAAAARITSGISD